MLSPITVTTDAIAAETFGPVNPQPVPEVEPRISSQKTNDLTGFFADQDRVSITPLAQQKATADQQITNTENNSNEIKDEAEEPSNDFIQVSSSIGRAASSGNLRREEAMAIYQKIASLI